MYSIYIMTNKTNSVLYIGVTNELRRRVKEHKNGQIEGFTQKYKLHKLVYYENFSDVNMAIAREKQLKGWTRVKKERLIENMNPEWNDFSEGFI